MICWIHGANSTHRSFNYIRLDRHSCTDLIFEYSVDVPLSENLRALNRLLDRNPDVSAIVGHSLGGVMAAVMKIRRDIPRIVTIASPLGGSKLANFVPVSRMLYDVGSMRPIYREITRHTFDETTLCVVTSNDGGYSDGIVTVMSQLSANGSKIKTVDLNHFEVLLDPNVKQAVLEHVC